LLTTRGCTRILGCTHSRPRRKHTASSRANCSLTLYRNLQIPGWSIGRKSNSDERQTRLGLVRRETNTFRNALANCFRAFDGSLHDRNQHENCEQMMQIKRRAPGRRRAGLCGRVPARSSTAGQRSESGVCPVPCRIEVATIECDQRARGFRGSRPLDPTALDGRHPEVAVPAAGSPRAGGSVQRASSGRPDGSDRTRAWRGVRAAPAASRPGVGCQCHTSFPRAGAARPA